MTKKQDISSSKIRTYDSESFRGRFMLGGEQLDDLLRSGYGKFFIVRIQDMIRLMKLPLPPARVVTHTMMYLTEGYATMTIGSETYTVKKDGCLFVAAGQAFSIGNVDVDSATGFLCSFHNDLPAGGFTVSGQLRDFEFLNVWGNPHIVLPPQTSQYVRQLMERLFAEYQENDIRHTDIIQSYFTALLCEINTACVPANNSRQTAAAALANTFRELLFAHIKTHQRVSDYAALMNISPNHLNKSVKSATGKSPTKWIDEAIVLEAKILLHQSNLPVSGIAEAVGIMDSSYFSRLFKKYEGLTPLEFRRRIEKS